LGIVLDDQYVPIQTIIGMLRADCLRNLMKFQLESDRHHVTEQYWSPVFNAFTSILSSVEEVWLNTPFHPEWCKYLARMSNLKILDFQRFRNRLVGLGSTKDRKPQIDKELDAAFATFIKKPRFAIHSDYRNRGVM